MFIIFCLLFLPFLKFVLSTKYYKYVIVPDVSCGTWNSVLVTLFANKHDYTVNKLWRKKVVSLRLQEETSSLSRTQMEQCFKNLLF